MAVPDDVRSEPRSMGHEVQAVPTVAGSMNAIQFHDDGRLMGAACWRAARRSGLPAGWLDLTSATSEMRIKQALFEHQTVIASSRRHLRRQYCG